MSRAPGGPSDGSLTLALALVGAVGGAAVVLWAGAALATVIVVGHFPDGGLGSALAMTTTPGDPARAWPPDAGVPGPVVVWGCVALVIGSSGGTAWLGWRSLGRLRAGPAARRRGVHSITGLANGADVRLHASRRALVARASTLRPSLPARPAPEELGFRLGRARGVEVWSAVEDSVLVIGPPRSGKGLHLVVGAVLDAPGAVLTTSTRADTLAVTIAERERLGPVSVFDPQGLSGLERPLRWSPVNGCERPQTAMIRARALAASTGMDKGSVSAGDFWQGRSAEAIQCLLHAGALDGRGVDRLYRWSLDPATARSAVQVLRAHQAAATGWAEALEAVISADERTRDSVWLGVRQAFAALADPEVREALTPQDGQVFDPAAFLEGRGTLYLLGTSSGASATAGFVSALVEDVADCARRRANRSPAARLDPPVSFLLDEIANLAPLPSLPRLMADGGGTGICTWVVLQSLAKARAAWGADDAQAIWDSAIVKVVLGGTSSSRDLDDLAKLVGDRDETTVALSRGVDGHRSTSASVRRVPMLPPSVIRSLPFGTAIVLLRSAPAMAVDMTPWTRRRGVSAATSGE